mmetsp:Transcript_12838/g.22253  ORF Transcript_12838/g.22253 Transcript_12838/m.22253 type:complete len:292 (+) Transcript_12838:934-1809(+)
MEIVGVAVLTESCDTLQHLRLQGDSLLIVEGHLGFLRFMSKPWPKAAEDPDVAFEVQVAVVELPSPQHVVLQDLLPFLLLLPLRAPKLLKPSVELLLTAISLLHGNLGIQQLLHRLLILCQGALLSGQASRKPPVELILRTQLIQQLMQLRRQRGFTFTELKNAQLGLLALSPLFLALRFHPLLRGVAPTTELLSLMSPGSQLLQYSLNALLLLSPSLRPCSLFTLGQSRKATPGLWRLWSQRCPWSSWSPWLDLNSCSLVFLALKPIRSDSVGVGDITQHHRHVLTRDDT